MNAKEIMVEWQRNHPEAPKPPDNIEQLIGLLVGDGDKKQAAELASKIVEKRNAQRIEAKRNGLLELRKILLAHKECNADGFLDDHSLDDIWNLTRKADSYMATFVKFVLSAWKSTFQDAVKSYQTAITTLCNRWGFDDIAQMLRFILIDGTKYIGTCCFLQGEDHDVASVVSGIDWKLRKSEDEVIADLEEMRRRLEKVLGDDGITIDENERFIKDGEELDSLWADLLDVTRHVDDDDFDEGVLICDAIYICFHPDIIERLSDAEILLRVLYCFLNGATLNDQAVRYGLLRKRIAELEEELSGA